MLYAKVMHGCPETSASAKFGCNTSWGFVSCDTNGHNSPKRHQGKDPSSPSSCTDACPWQTALSLMGKGLGLPQTRCASTDQAAREVLAVPDAAGSHCRGPPRLKRLKRRRLGPAHCEVCFLDVRRILCRALEDQQGQRKDTRTFASKTLWVTEMGADCHSVNSFLFVL